MCTELKEMLRRCNFDVGGRPVFLLSGEKGDLHLSRSAGSDWAHLDNYVCRVRLEV